MPTISNIIFMDQFDYELLAIKERWSLGEAVDLLTCFEMVDKGYYDKDNAKHVCTRLWDKYYTYVTGLMLGGAIRYKTRFDTNNVDLMRQEALGGSLINSETSTFEQAEFIEYVKNNNELKLDIEKLKMCLSGDEIISSPTSLDNLDVMQETYSEEVNSTDLKYPTYKGLELEDLTKEMFEEIKKYYGMLQREEAKSRKAIPIATNIGLLFYEKGLSKPATEPAFLEAYKKNFDGIPMRLVNVIYDSLPDKYHNLACDHAKETEGIDDDMLDMIIETSVAAGLICCKDEVKDAKGLEEQLTRYEFELPPVKYLQYISGACKRVTKKFKAKQI